MIKLPGTETWNHLFPVGFFGSAVGFGSSRAAGRKIDANLAIDILADYNIHFSGVPEFIQPSNKSLAKTVNATLFENFCDFHSQMEFLRIIAIAPFDSNILCGASHNCHAC